ncbi:exonuclease domain-containing protein [Anaerolineales bacterium]
MNIHKNPQDFEEARRWALELLAKPNFYIFDTETTGLGNADRIVQIGIINKQGETILNTLVNPQRPIPLEASRIHGISDADVRDAPTILDLYLQLSMRLAGQTLVAYNMDFDWRLLKQTLEGHQLPMIRVSTTHCAMKVYAKYYGQQGNRGSYRWQKLVLACEQCGIPVENAHDALGDVRMTLKLIEAMARR